MQKILPISDTVYTYDIALVYRRAAEFNDIVCVLVNIMLVRYEKLDCSKISN